MNTSCLDILHRESIYNRAEVLTASAVGCFQCIRVYSPTAICKWTDEGQTAICPHCDIDAVLPEVTDVSLLNSMHERWFSRE